MRLLADGFDEEDIVVVNENVTPLTSVTEQDLARLVVALDAVHLRQIKWLKPNDVSLKTFGSFLYPNFCLIFRPTT